MREVVRLCGVYVDVPFLEFRSMFHRRLASGIVTKGVGVVVSVINVIGVVDVISVCFGDREWVGSGL